MKSFAKPPLGDNDHILSTLMRIMIAFNPDFVRLQQVKKLDYIQ